MREGNQVGRPYEVDKVKVCFVRPLAPFVLLMFDIQTFERSTSFIPVEHFESPRSDHPSLAAITPIDFTNTFYGDHQHIDLMVILRRSRVASGQSPHLGHLSVHRAKNGVFNIQYSIFSPQSRLTRTSGVRHVSVLNWPGACTLFRDNNELAVVLWACGRIHWKRGQHFAINQLPRNSSIPL